MGAWGVRGHVKVEPLGPPELLAPGRSVSVLGRPHTIEGFETRDRTPIIHLNGIAAREDARRLIGAYLQAPESDLPALPEGEYYRYQLLGLAVRAGDGRELGRVTDVFSTPQNDVYVVDGPNGELLIPAIDDIVLDVDLDARTMTVDAVPGLLSSAR